MRRWLMMFALLVTSGWTTACAHSLSQDADQDGYTVQQGDCDDTRPDIHPGAVEICDYADSNCDGLNQDLEDVDGDGYSVCDGDCDETDSAVAWWIIEQCDGKDIDCDGLIDDDIEGGCPAPSPTPERELPPLGPPTTPAPLAREHDGC